MNKDYQYSCFWRHMLNKYVLFFWKRHTKLQRNLNILTWTSFFCKCITRYTEERKKISVWFKCLHLKWTLKKNGRSGTEGLALLLWVWQQKLHFNYEVNYSFNDWFTTCLPSKGVAQILFYLKDFSFSVEFGVTPHSPSNA